MRWYEIITEDGDSASGTGGVKGRRKKLSKNQVSSIPGLTSYPDTPAHYYAMYRFGMHMAGSPEDNHDMSPNGPAGNEMATMAYSKVDQEIIDNSRKAMGFKRTRVTTGGSKENNDTGSKSPVAQWNKTK
jgi:hypothetical protein